MKVAAPKLPAVLELASAGLFGNEASIEACRFVDAEWSEVVASSVSLDEVVIEKCVLAEAKLVKFAARDALFNNCNLSAAQCAEASFQRVSFKGGRMTGWDCNRGMFKDVTFENCKLDMANFRFMKLNRVRFVGCMLADTDFIHAELTDVSFEDCLLERTDFGQAKLKNVDLRTSQLIELKGWQYLKGATIDNVQLLSVAAYLAAEIGISVVD